MEIKFSGGKVVSAYTHGHIIITDQPQDNGGSGTAPSPFDLYLASIGTCTAMYIKSFCDKRNIPTDRIKIIQETKYNDVTELPEDITIEIKLPPDFPEKYKSTLICTAELCTVKKSILDPPEFKIVTS